MKDWNVWSTTASRMLPHFFHRDMSRLFGGWRLTTTRCQQQDASSDIIFVNKNHLKIIRMLNSWDLTKKTQHYEIFRSSPAVLSILSSCHNRMSEALSRKSHGSELVVWNHLKSWMSNFFRSSQIGWTTHVSQHQQLAKISVTCHKILGPICTHILFVSVSSQIWWLTWAPDRTPRHHFAQGCLRALSTPPQKWDNHRP